MKVNKKANSEAEKRNLEYLEGLDSPELIRKINATDKDIPDALNYVKNQVRSRAVNGCAAVEDVEVFGMVIHYFEEDSIKKGTSPAKSNRIEIKTQKPKEEKPKAAAVQKSNDLAGQMSLFDL